MRAAAAPERARAHSLLEEAAGRLERAGVEGARREAEELLAWAHGIGRLRLRLEGGGAGSTALARFQAAIERRVRREPLQYITGEAGFRELTLRVRPGVLIPRPETEMLVQLVLERTEGGAGGLSVLDLGTGSGAIALSLAAEGGFGRIVASDRSPAALEIARENARRCGLEERVEIRRGAGYGALAEEERFDVVVSNPPYVAEAERGELAPEVADWEPEEALFAGPEGLDLIRELVRGAPGHLSPGGLLALEVSATHAARAAALARTTRGLTDVELIPDLAGRARFVLARRVASIAG